MNRRTALSLGVAASASLAGNAGLAATRADAFTNPESVAAPSAVALLPADAVAAVSRARRASFIERTDGTTLFYKDWGSGRPVLFIHGAGLRSDSWAAQMESVVGTGFRGIAFDRRGHGRSSDPGRGQDDDTLADDIAAILDTLDLHEVTIVGHAQGGGEIARYLTRHGEARVVRVAMVEPPRTI